MTGGLQVSNEVRQLLGEDVLRTVVQQSGAYVCRRCSTEGSVDRNPTSLVVELRPDVGRVVVLSPLDCEPSSVVALEEAAQYARRTIERDMTSMAVLFPSTTGPGDGQPFLLISSSGGLRLITDQGDSMDPLVTQLLDEGWQLAGVLAQPIEPPRHGWFVRVGAEGVGAVHGVNTVLLDKLPPLPAAWLQAARAMGQVAVVIGPIDLPAGHTVTMEEVGNALIAAAETGATVLGLLPVDWVQAG